MKVERLYGITIYLLNHGRASAAELAKYFEVSVRTIQRDIDSLCVVGIPIIALTGVQGGYEIAEGFKLDKQMATSDEYAYILTALRGLTTATNNPKIRQALEKIENMHQGTETGVVLDFSVLNEEVNNILPILQRAVLSKKIIQFEYTNNQNECRKHQVEPVAVVYRWYAWYLLAYSRVKEDYRTYKVIRMKQPKVLSDPFTREHPPVGEILKEIEEKNSYATIEVTIYCKARIKVRAMEYLKSKIIKEYSNGDALMSFMAVRGEQFWFGTLLSLGDEVEVVEPEEIRKRIIASAQKILALYHKL